MLTNSLIDDFGQQRICWKFYQDGSHVLHWTGGDRVRSQTQVIETYFDDELGAWMALVVWKDSPESGPRMVYCI